ncbi:hypothetical protein C475_01646 [Halosimplex carlsbadense 2-9-1]|uniref:DUF7573 domain-containing protein n=1 Tax=Halosimplex carlsbadense 2-9-1 TaxID=797114 RepID=M0D4K5_9EURY|nr:hypothetical protein [Halosimplex carlsbadense]ELZ29612.1 hypothetical protein C475_01646 [Halosimplex carlsbadense 2-9-1]
MGDRSLDDFLDGDDGGDGTEESPDRPEEAVDDSVDAEADDPDGVEIGADDGTDGSDDGDEGEPEEDSDTDEDGVRVDPTTVEPAEATYAWSTDGDACAACGETVERRWRSEEGLVCPDCKEW